MSSLNTLFSEYNLYNYSSSCVVGTCALVEVTNGVLHLIRDAGTRLIDAVRVATFGAMRFTLPAHHYKTTACNQRHVNIFRKQAKLAKRYHKQ